MNQWICHPPSFPAGFSSNQHRKVRGLRKPSSFPAGFSSNQHRKVRGLRKPSSFPHDLGGNLKFRSPIKDFGDDKRFARGLFIGIFLTAFLISNISFAEETAFELTSPAFENGGLIPKAYTCDGKNKSPALYWKGAPRGTQSFVLIAEDPDAPLGDWTHWILFNLPPVISNLPQGLPPIKTLANNEKHGTNSFQKLGYGGPCPPSGIHRYHFRLYAVDQMLMLKPGVRKQALLKAMEGHILAEAELTGRYGRKKKT